LVDSIEVFNIRYTTDPNFDMNAKNDWKINTKSNKDGYDRRHKGLINAAKQQTAENAAAAQEKGVLEFNPVRLAAVTIHILEHKLVRVMLTDLANYDEEELKIKYNESELRYCLMGQLVASTGKRSDAIANMKVGALQRGKLMPNGCWVVTVKEHKTFVSYGPSLVTFETTLLFQAAMVYMHAYRDPSMEDDYLFANLNKKPTQIRQSIQWMKDKLIKGFCNEEELKSLSAKAFRKAFSNWGRDHHDLDVRENVCEVQDHSQNVQQTNYATASCRKASFVTKSIIDFIKSKAYRNGSTDLPGG
jgi:DNA gyrase/topoisomerase IV subunit B